MNATSLHRNRNGRNLRLASGMGAAVFLSVLQSGCVDAPLLTAPDAPAAQVRATFPGAAVGVANCQLGVLTPSGAYRTKALPTRFPDKVSHPQGETVLAVYREWVNGLPDPARLVACQIPATPAAAQWFNEHFANGRATPAVARQGGRTSETGPAATTADPFTTSPAVEYDGYAITVSECQPYELVSETGEHCGGGDTGGGEWEGPAPYEGESTDATVDGSAEYVQAYNDSSGQYVMVQPSCFGRTDNPHRSTHVPGTINVIAKTECNFVTSMSVSTNLQLQRCWGYVCWWSTQRRGYNSGVARFVRANAAAPCQTGYWRGFSGHTVVFPNGSSGSTYTGGYARISFC